MLVVSIYLLFKKVKNCPQTLKIELQSLDFSSNKQNMINFTCYYFTATINTDYYYFVLHFISIYIYIQYIHEVVHTIRTNEQFE